ncbi:hypothetical protein IAR55_004528 [Kwoniella newhampshirensis]|uniref:AB hydrolase-1 domain-containing protein n=1 Tax=Kwoniella newhampshirensis TaxID=1651941 RepID=A0AAW0YJU9_9TREE
MLEKACYLVAVSVGLYAVVLGLVTLPSVQRELVFLHHIQLPLFPDYSNPQQYGLAPFKTRNLRLNTSDGESTGAWHVLPRSVYTSLKPFPPEGALPETVFDQAISDRPTLIYFHGNAGNRATSHRVREYLGFSNHLDCNVLAVDYRGFADSSGTPSEHGLLLDARTAYGFVHSKLASSLTKTQKESDDQIILVGHSLGTGVVAALSGMLASEGRSPRALVLIAPFTSITELLSSYKLFEFIPLLAPLNYFPSAKRLVHSFLYHPFDSQKALKNTTSPTLLVHAVNDGTIPPSHSLSLFASLNTPHYRSSVHTTTYEGWGTVRSFDRGEGKGGEVIWWEGQKGGHNNLGWAEGTLDLIARIARL